MPFPGTFPVALFTSGDDGVVTTLAQVASALSTLATITGPAAILAGDLLVLWDVGITTGANPPAFAMPAGFTVVNDTPLATNRRGVLSFKIATGAEASASL